MNVDLENSVEISLSAVLPFLISLLDDVLLLGFARMGWNVPWLHWLATIALVGTLIFTAVRIFKSKFFKNLIARKTLKVE